ncbi:MAG: hypothetical protein ACMG6S_32330, partial [Byssovorax sp.]
GAPRLRSVLPSAPEGLEKIILKCLQKDRNERYGNVAELAAALVEFGPAAARESAERSARILHVNSVNSGKGSPPPPSFNAPLLAGSATPADPNASQGPWDRSGGEPAPRRASRAILALAGVVVVALAAGAFAFLRGDAHAVSPLSPSAEPALATSPVAATSAHDTPVPSVAPALIAPALVTPTAAASASAAPPVAAAPSAAARPASTAPRSRPPVSPPADPFGGSQK